MKHDYIRQSMLAQKKELIKRYKEGYRKKPEQTRELKAIEKAEIETLTKEHWTN